MLFNCEGTLFTENIVVDFGWLVVLTPSQRIQILSAAQYLTTNKCVSICFSIKIQKNIVCTETALLLTRETVFSIKSPLKLCASSLNILLQCSFLLWLTHLSNVNLCLSRSDKRIFAWQIVLRIPNV